MNIFDNPGTADLSAYVDFAAIKHSAEEVSGLFLLLTEAFLLPFPQRKSRFQIHMG